MARISFDIDIAEVVGQMGDLEDDIDDGSEAVVDQLSILAEGAMKKEAPEGVGLPSVHMRDTIRTEKSTDGHRAVIQPHKKTDEGWDLHRAIVGNPSTPTYGDEGPPVWTDGSGTAQGPIARWADAKLGDRNDAWAVQKSIKRDGQQTFPDRFIDRSYAQWASQIDGIANEAVSGEID